MPPATPPRSAAKVPRLEKFRPRVAALVLVVAVAIAYSNSLQGEFIFDDLASIPENTAIRSLWPLTSILWPPHQTDRTVDGRPLVGLSVAVNYAVSGLEVWSYHALNLLIHVLAALALMGLVRRTLLLPLLRDRFDSQATAIGFAVALLWALHPLQTESVTYIIQRAESMVGLFYLFTMYCVVRGESSGRPVPWRIAAWVACLAGMATKEVMVTAPVAILFYLGVFVLPSWRQTLVQRWRLLAGLFSTWILLALLLTSLDARASSVDMSSSEAVKAYALMQPAVILYYLKLCVSPAPLVLDYGARIVNDPLQIIVSIGIIGTMLLVAAALLWRRHWIGFLGAVFFLTLAPSSSVVPILTQTVAEHRMYLPLASVVCLAVVLTHLAMQKVLRAPKHAANRMHALPIVVLSLAALLLGTQTWLRNLDYRTSYLIWKDTVEKQPLNDRAHANLSRAYLAAGDWDMAMLHANRAVELNPRSRGPFYGRGTLYLQTGDFAKALDDLNRALKISPGFAEALQNRGVALRRLNRPQDALADFNRALEVNPQLHITYRSRALTLAELGRMPEARADANRYLQFGGVLDEELRAILMARP